MNSNQLRNSHITVETKYVTCKDVQIGDTIICLDYEPAKEYAERDRIPMTVSTITTMGEGRKKTYRYFTEDGTYITFGGGRTLIQKVIEAQ